MDRFVKNFIAMSMTYLVLASIVGIIMLFDARFLALRFVHSHLMLLGWVTMMIYGVGYHILPRFAGKLIQNKTLCEIQFLLANIGLVGMVGSYTAGVYAGAPGTYRVASVIFGGLEVVAVIIFFYTMWKTIFVAAEEAQ